MDLAMGKHLDDLNEIIGNKGANPFLESGKKIVITHQWNDRQKKFVDWEKESEFI